MADTRSPRGLLVELVTPLKTDGTLDRRGLARLLDQVAGDCQGLFLASPIVGEGRQLGTDVRAELLQESLTVLRGRRPVMIWISAEEEERTRETLRALEAIRGGNPGGGEVFFVDSPLYYRSNRGLAALYEDFRAMTEDAPFLLYNDHALASSRTRPLKRTNIRTAILKDLSRRSQVVGLIFSGSFERAQGYQKAVRGRPDFRIYDGNEEHFLDFPSMSGVVSRGANLEPKTWQTITQSSLHLQGSSQEYPDFLRHIWESGNYLRHLKNLYDPSPAAVIKAVLARRGVIESPFCHTPLNNAEAVAAEISDVMKAAG